MRTLLAVAFGLAFLPIVPQPVSAQCCGQAEPVVRVQCPGGCGLVWLYQCNGGAGNDWMPLVEVCADCGGFGTYAFAGYCYNGVVSSLRLPAQNPAATNGQTSEYVDVYLRACTGYVPVQMAMARQGG